MKTTQLSKIALKTLGDLVDVLNTMDRDTPLSASIQGINDELLTGLNVSIDPFAKTIVVGAGQFGKIEAHDNRAVLYYRDTVDEYVFHRREVVGETKHLYRLRFRRAELKSLLNGAKVEVLDELRDGFGLDYYGIRYVDRGYPGIPHANTHIHVVDVGADQPKVLATKQVLGKEWLEVVLVRDLKRGTLTLEWWRYNLPDLNLEYSPERYLATRHEMVETAPLEMIQM